MRTMFGISLPADVRERVELESAEGARQGEVELGGPLVALVASLGCCPRSRFITSDYARTRSRIFGEMGVTNHSAQQGVFGKEAPGHACTQVKRYCYIKMVRSSVFWEDIAQHILLDTYTGYTTSPGSRRCICSLHKWARTSHGEAGNAGVQGAVSGSHTLMTPPPRDIDQDLRAAQDDCMKKAKFLARSSIIGIQKS